MQPRIPLPKPFNIQGFTTPDGHAAGLGRHRMRGADLVHPFQGVRLKATPELTVVDLCTALQRRLPADAFFCGLTSAYLFGMPLPASWKLSTPLHVAVPAPSTSPIGRGIRGHSYRVRDDDVIIIRGIRTSSAVRTWCELSAILSLEDLVAVGDFIIHWENPLADHNDMVGFARHFPSPRGRGRRREALPLLHERSESRRESILRMIFVRAHLNGLEVNFPIKTSGGFRYRADLAFPEARIVVEYQSAFHETPERFRSDMTRKSRLTTDGWSVVEVNSDDLLRPVELVTRIRQLLKNRQPWGR